MTQFHTDNLTPEIVYKDRRVLELLAQSFPNISAASTEIINLEAILNLPKGTEHFAAVLADLLSGTQTTVDKSIGKRP